MSPFWQLPEPARYLRAIVEDLRAGSNVVLAVPDHTPDGRVAALSAALSTANLPNVQEIQPNGSTPVAAIHELLTLGPCPPKATVMDLCDNEGFRRRLLHLQPFTSASWPTWSNFLLQYEDACRQLPLPDRTLFVVELCGELAANAPDQANLLRVHPWLARMDGLNTRLLAAEQLGAGNIQIPWQRQLAVATLAELALWDPEVVATGASLTLDQILEPEPWLAQIGAARGWTPNDDLRSPASRWRGLRQPFEERPRTHSAWLALASRSEALSQRLWTAQVASLFPFLERHRRGLIHCYRKMFKLPWTTTFGPINAAEDLELGHIADQLRLTSGRLRDTARFVRWLRDIRNELAHLKPAPAALLLDSQFQSRMETFLPSADD